MAGIDPIAALGSAGAEPLISRLGAMPPAVSGEASQAGFASILTDGMRAVETRLDSANDLVRRFAIDDSVPLHQVTYALEEARLAVELAMQVRTRLVESYRELMNMQM